MTFHRSNDMPEHANEQIQIRAIMLIRYKSNYANSIQIRFGYLK